MSLYDADFINSRVLSGFLRWLQSDKGMRNRSEREVSSNWEMQSNRNTINHSNIIKSVCSHRIVLLVIAVSAHVLQMFVHALPSFFMRLCVF